MRHTCSMANLEHSNLLNFCQSHAIVPQESWIVPEKHQIHGFLAQIVVLVQISFDDAPQVVDIHNLFVFLLVQF